MELDENFFNNKSTVCLAQQISVLCNEKINKSPKNTKINLKKNDTHKSNTPSYISSGFSPAHCTTNAGFSQWAKIKKDISKLKLNKLRNTSSLQKKRSMSYDSQDNFKIGLEKLEIPLSPIN